MSRVENNYFPTTYFYYSFLYELKHDTLRCRRLGHKIYFSLSRYL